MRKIGILITLAALWGGAVASAEPPYIQMAGLVHVHTTASTGAYTLDELIERAEQEGLEALILTENFALRFEYGLFPLRKWLRMTRRYPSLYPPDMEAYVQQIRGARARYPHVILIPGIEVCPSYFWTGSPLHKDLTMHNGQKNLLVVGLEDPKAYRAISRLLGRSSRYTGYSVFLFLVPTGVCAVGLVLFRLKRRIHRRIGPAIVVQEKRYRIPGLLVVLAGALAFVYHVPFKVDEYDPYHNAGLGPHQKLINRVRELGGMTFWSMPEARDFSTHAIGCGTVTIRTDPYPNDLIATTGYTGFGAIYEDTITFTDPGNGWDQILTQYCRGSRSAPVWGIGEAAYHEESYQHIGNVQTVLLVRTKSQVEVEQALRSGRCYAVFREAGATPLRLNTFVVTSERDTIQVAGMGEELITDAHPIIHVTVSGDTLSGPFRLDLIRSGELLYHTQTVPPYELAYRDPSPVVIGKRHYYRVKVSSPSTYILSNPIFVRAE